MSKIAVKQGGRKGKWEDGVLTISGCGEGDTFMRGVPQRVAAAVLARVAKGDPPERWTGILAGTERVPDEQDL